MNKYPIGLTIAGSDSGGGAGIQNDIKIMQKHEVFATSVITAVTAQNTQGVFAVEGISAANVKAQLDAVLSDFAVDVIKIGMLLNTEIIETVANRLQTCRVPIVLDPVMIAKGGQALLLPEAISSLRDRLLPLATVVTPNIPEAEALTGISIRDYASRQQAAKALQTMGASVVIIKGGHASGEVLRDDVFLPDQHFYFESPRIATQQTHGTGCMFSALIASHLARGEQMTMAITKAKWYLQNALTDPLNFGKGHGPVNYFFNGDAPLPERKTDENL